MKFKFLLLASILTLAIGGNALAISPSAINVDVAPQNPAPNGNVTITLSSFGANLDIVTISWLVNGRTALTGIGVKSFSTSVGGVGTETRVVAKIMLPDGEIDKNIILRPSVLVLLWQANDSFVPPFYRGKALATEGSEIKVVALPEIRTGNTTAGYKTLSYEWKKNYENDAADSGYGKNFLVYSSDYLDDVNNVSVVASTIDGKYSSGGGISVGSYQPHITFYREDEELGTLWEQALSNPYRLTGGEVISAAPYFITPADIRRPELVFKWFINEVMLAPKIVDKNLIPLRAEGGTSGTSKLRLEIENTDDIFNTASKEINIEF